MRRLPARLLGLPLAALVATGAPAVPGPAPAAGAPASASTTAPARVVVQAHAGPAAAAAAVAAVGGRTTLALPVVDGVAAEVPADAVERLGGTAGVRAVTPDATVHMSAETTAGTSTVPASLNAVLLREIGADELHAAGTTGAGVGVALVDTGVSPVPDVADRLTDVADPHQPLASLRGQVACVDLSGERRCDDSYGHGTFMAGLIAGTGSASGGRFSGVAPGAHLVSIKIAGRDGSADVSKVLAAIQWATSFKDDYGLRVLNLSLGTNSTVSPSIDPLNRAVQRAWQSGLVVVVAASNRGPAPGTISKPADDPLVLTVGAVDDRETPATSDDRSPAFSGRGPTAHGLAKPDVVAPGGRVVSLRAPGSLVDEAVPQGVLDATYRRGSGTSMSAAVVSGLAALLLQAQPDWTPDRVKHALTSTAVKVASKDASVVGAGLVHGPGALAAAEGPADQGATLLSDGSGSLDGSRGDVRVQDDCGLLGPCTPTGSETSNGRLFDGDAYAEGDWTGQSWYSSQWVSPLGQSWYASEWLGQSWYGQSWYGSSWYGSEDPSTSYGVPVPGSAWYGAWG